MNNRIIKFRVYDRLYKDWLANDTFAVSDKGTESNQGNFIIQQFTGLKDKNGKEIYEGDIVSIEDHYEIEFYGGEVENRLGKIVYSDKNMAFIISFNLKSNKINEDNSLSYDTLNMSSIKIKGNIFENPELLNK